MLSCHRIGFDINLKQRLKSEQGMLTLSRKVKEL